MNKTTRTILVGVTIILITGVIASSINIYAKVAVLEERSTSQREIINRIDDNVQKINDKIERVRMCGIN